MGIKWHCHEMKLNIYKVTKEWILSKKRDRANNIHIWWGTPEIQAYSIETTNISTMFCNKFRSFLIDWAIIYLWTTKQQIMHRSNGIHCDGILCTTRMRLMIVDEWNLIEKQLQNIYLNILLRMKKIKIKFTCKTVFRI